MPITSSWPLPSKGVRFVTPQPLIDVISKNLLSKDLYPLAAGFYPKAYQHEMRRNIHNNHLLVYCVEGKGNIDIKGQSWPVNAGDLMYLPKRTEHQYQANASQPWTIYWVHYDGELADNYNDLMNISPSITNIGLHSKLIADFEALFSLRNGAFTEPAFIHGSCLLKKMLSNVALLTTMSRHIKSQRINLDLTRELMHRHLDTQLDLGALAANAQMSKYHFSRKFKQLTGQSPIQHFIHLKMQYACQLLDSSTLSIKEIAAKLGYNDSYYFSRLFKKVIGLSPGKYTSNRLS